MTTTDPYSSSKRMRDDAYLGLNGEEEDEDERAELRFADKDEDRTVQNADPNQSSPHPDLPQFILSS